MVLPSHAIPTVGDIYVAVKSEVRERDHQPWWRQLLRLPATVTVINYEFRRVLAITPTVVLYELQAEGERHYAAWLNDWVDWADNADRIFHKGKPASQEELDRVVGQVTLPFNITHN